MSDYYNQKGSEGSFPGIAAFDLLPKKVDL